MLDKANIFFFYCPQILWLWREIKCFSRWLLALWEVEPRQDVNFFSGWRLSKPDLNGWTDCYIKWYYFYTIASFQYLYVFFDWTSTLSHAENIRYILSRKISIIWSRGPCSFGKVFLIQVPRRSVEINPLKIYFSEIWFFTTGKEQNK